MKRLNWTQTEQQSCGAAALMVALGELGGGKLSAAREMDLWHTIRAREGEPGSMPGRIALRAVAEGLSGIVWLDENRLALAEHALGARAAFDVPTLLAEHRRALDEAVEAGIEIRREEVSPDAFLNVLEAGVRLLIAVIVLASEGRVNLHWLLCRQDEGSLFIMDPACGADSCSPFAAFRQLLMGPAYVGAAITIQARGHP